MRPSNPLNTWFFCMLLLSRYTTSQMNNGYYVETISKLQKVIISRTLSVLDPKSESCNKSSTAQEGEVKLEACCKVVFTETTRCAFWLGGSKQFLFSESLLHLELKATWIPVASKRWWLADRLPAEWIGSSQSWQNRALSSTQNMKAAFSCGWDREDYTWRTRNIHLQVKKHFV